MEEAAPSGPCSHLGPELVDLVPVMLTTTSVDINLVNRQPTLSLPDISDGPEEEDNGESQVGHEEAFNSAHTGRARGSDNGNIELYLLAWFSSTCSTKLT